MVASELFSCTVSSVDFPLGPRNGIFVEACSDDCSPVPDSGKLCFPVLDDIGGGTALPVGVAPRMLILGGAGGADDVAVDDVFEGPASSAFFPTTDAIPACLPETRDEGGGLFNRGEAGHCGVVSPEAGPALFGPARAGNLDTASVTAPPEESWGTLLADKALWMAAAEGCDEKELLDKAPGRLSLRIGDVLREVLGLEVVEGDEEDGSSDAECCLRNVGVCMEDDDDAVLWRVALGLLRWTVAVEEADDMSEGSEGGPGGRSTGCSGWPFMA